MQLLLACFLLLLVHMLLLPAGFLLLPGGMLLLPACFLLLPVGRLLLHSFALLQVSGCLCLWGGDCRSCLTASSSWSSPNFLFLYNCFGQSVSESARPSG